MSSPCHTLIAIIPSIALVFNAPQKPTTRTSGTYGTTWIPESHFLGLSPFLEWTSLQLLMSRHFSDLRREKRGSKVKVLHPPINFLLTLSAPCRHLVFIHPILRIQSSPTSDSVLITFKDGVSPSRLLNLPSDALFFFLAGISSVDSIQYDDESGPTQQSRQSVPMGGYLCAETVARRTRSYIRAVGKNDDFWN